MPKVRKAANAVVKTTSAEGKAKVDSASEVKLALEKTSSKLMSDELKQLLEFTSGTSFGSASVTSAHWGFILSASFLSWHRGRQRTL